MCGAHCAQQYIHFTHHRHHRNHNDIMMQSINHLAIISLCVFSVVLFASVWLVVCAHGVAVCMFFAFGSICRWWCDVRFPPLSLSLAYLRPHLRYFKHLSALRSSSSGFAPFAERCTVSLLSPVSFTLVSLWTFHENCILSRPFLCFTHFYARFCDRLFI